MIELEFDIEPDANGVFDGRELGHALIQTAYALLTAYVNGCPACSDILFSALANGAIEKLHRDNDLLPCKIMSIEPDADGARWWKHACETKEMTDALMENKSCRSH